MKSGGFSCELWFLWFDFGRNDIFRPKYLDIYPLCKVQKPIFHCQACYNLSIFLSDSSNSGVLKRKKWANKLIHNALSVILFTVDNRLGGIPFRTVNRLKLNRWGKPHGLNHVVLYRKNWYFCCQYTMINLQGTPVGENVDGLKF